MEVDDVIVVQEGRWIMYVSGEWEFKINTSRQGRHLRLSELRSFKDLSRKVRELFGICGSSETVELSYWMEDILAEIRGVHVSPTFITNDRDFRAFKTVSLNNEGVNLFMTLKRIVDGEVVIIQTPQSLRKRRKMYLDGEGSGKHIDDTMNSVNKETTFSALLAQVQSTNFNASSLEEETMVAIASKTNCLNTRSTPEAEQVSNPYPVPDGLDDGGTNESELIAEVEELERQIELERRIELENTITSFAAGKCSEVDRLSDAVIAGAVTEDGWNNDESGGIEEEEEEEEDYDWDEMNEFVRNDRPLHVDDSDDDADDFVDPPISKKRKTEKRKVSAMSMEESLTVTLKKGLSLDEVYGYEDIESMFEEDIDFEESRMVDLTKEDDEIFVGRTFATREDYKTTLAIYAINRIFKFKYCKFDRDFLVAVCADRDICDWRVMAHRVGDTEEFEVRKVKLEHVCGTDTRRQFSKHATSRILSALLRSKYARDYCTPRARDVPDILRRENGIRVSYYKAWKARELAVATAQGTEEESYRLLPLYLYLLKLANPGTVTHLTTEKDEDENDRFKYAYLSLNACIQSLPYVRKVYVVDGTHLYGKYRGCLLTASCQDANYQIIPLAFAIVDSENDASWDWFFSKLVETIPDGDDTTFISDRNPSIGNGLKKIYPKSHHGFCLVHIRRNVKSSYKKGNVSSIVWRAGTRYRLRDFALEYERIKQRNPMCWEYLENIGVENWTRVYFKGKRFNQMSSNIAESLNHALVPARDSPVVALFEFIRKMIARWFECRRKKIGRTVGDIPIDVEKELLTRYKKSVSLEAVSVGVDDYEVKGSGKESFHVSLKDRSCSCLEFQTIELPCKHAMAAADVKDIEFRTLVGDMQKIRNWEPAVQGVVIPLPDPSEVNVPEDIRVLYVMQPKTKRPPGRPPKLRIHTPGEYAGSNKSQQPNKCSRCGGTGHNRATCKNPIG